MNEKLAKILNHPRRVPVAVGVIAFGAGVGLGYILGKRNPYELVKITDQVDIDPGDEIIEVKQNAVRPPPVVIPAELHPAFNKPLEEIQTPMSVVQNPEDTPVKTPYHVSPKEEKIIPQSPEDDIIDEQAKEEAETVRKSLFAQSLGEWNYKNEINSRNPSMPYVIHKDEFFEDSMQYAQVTLTYYAGDNILVDEDDSPIYNHDSVVGPLKFGHGSGDPNVVYVRNDKRKAEYEILYDSGMYSVEVLGLEMDVNERARDLKHSKDRKFRPE